MNVTLALQTVTFNCKFANAGFIATVPNWKSALISQRYGNVGIASAVTVAVKSHLRRGESYAWLEWQEEPNGDCACSERTKQANQTVARCSIHVVLFSERGNGGHNRVTANDSPLQERRLRHFGSCLGSAVGWVLSAVCCWRSISATKRTSSFAPQ